MMEQRSTLLSPHHWEKEKIHMGTEVSFKVHSINISPNDSKHLWRHQLKQNHCFQQVLAVPALVIWALKSRSVSSHLGWVEGGEVAACEHPDQGHVGSHGE